MVGTESRVPFGGGTSRGPGLIAASRDEILFSRCSRRSTCMLGEITTRWNASRSKHPRYRYRAGERRARNPLGWRLLPLLLPSSVECRCSSVSNRVAGEGHCFALPGKIGERNAVIWERERERGIDERFVRAIISRLNHREERKYWRGAIYWNTCYF